MRKLSIVLLLLSVCSTQLWAFKYTISLREVNERYPELTRFKENSLEKGTELTYIPTEVNQSISLVNTPIKSTWQKSKFLVLRLYSNNSYLTNVISDFCLPGNPRPRLSISAGLLPYTESQLVIPLEYLNANQIYLPRQPGIMKIRLSGNAIDLADIAELKLRVEPFRTPDFKTEITIYEAYLTDKQPNDLPPLAKPIVDSLGQWATRDWQGRTKSVEAMKQFGNYFIKKLNNTETYENVTDFGGYKLIKFEATGYFRTHNDGKRWWLVDPEGYAFLSHGVTGIRPGIPATYKGFESFYKYIPAPGTKEEKVTFVETNRGKQIDYQRLNLYRTYGDNWKEKWEELTKKELKDFGINTIANWSDSALCAKAQIPYVLPLKKFPKTKTLLFRDFPDVYSPEYQLNSQQFAKQLIPYKGDRYLIGYFLANEPEWAFGNNNLALEMLNNNSKSFTRDELKKWLMKECKNDIGTLNRLLGSKLKSFKDFEKLVIKYPSQVTADGKKILFEFSKLMVEKYLEVVCKEVKSVDAYHLNLGIRYAWISSELCYVAGKYFDVFSVNGYSFGIPPATNEIASRTGKPVMIGEFHHGAIDRGLPACGIQGVANQQERGAAYQTYVEFGFARPEVVGIHYFQWNDQPITGRFDGENYNIGIVDICNKPYMEMVQSIKSTAKNLYKVATSAQEPSSAKAVPIPQIY